MAAGHFLEMTAGHFFAMMAGHYFAMAVGRFFEIIGILQYAILQTLGSDVLPGLGWSWKLEFAGSRFAGVLD